MNQVAKQHIKDWRDSYGFAVKQKEKIKKQMEKQLKNYGPLGKQDTDLYKAQRQKLYNKKHNALRTGIDFDIDFVDIDWPTHCPLLGIELDYFVESRQENSVSFDRINPAKGYVKGNVLVCSWRGNRIKNDGSSAEHRRIADYLDSIEQ
jgi:hypothetical protein